MSALTPVTHEHGIIQIDANFIDPGIACVYLLHRQSKLAIIETGTTHTVPNILKTISDLGATPDCVEWIIPTHIHLDHAGGAGELMQLCPKAKLLIHPNGVAHMIDPSRLEAGTMRVYGEDSYRALYGTLIPVDPDRIVEAHDNDEVIFAETTLKIIDTPGHALHHFCLYDETSQSVFTGDTLGISYRLYDSPDKRHFMFATTTPTQFDPVAMKESIDRVLAFGPKKLFLTHYGAIVPSEAVINQLKNSIDIFVDIAKSELTSTVDRQQKIENKIYSWAVSKIAEEGFSLSGSIAQQRLLDDAKLNAQGLEYWLRRLEK